MGSDTTPAPAFAGRHVRVQAATVDPSSAFASAAAALSPMARPTLMEPWVASWGRHQERVVWTRLKRLMETRAGEPVGRHEQGLPLAPDQCAAGRPRKEQARAGGLGAHYQAPPRSKLGTAAAGLEVLLAVGALAGGLALMLGPQGQILSMPTSQLRGSPFASCFVPGLVLFTVLGVGPLLAAASAWRGQRLAPLLALLVGAALLAWLAVEIAIIGYSSDPPLQPIYIALGVGIALVGLAWVRQERSQPE